MDFQVVVFRRFTFWCTHHIYAYVILSRLRGERMTSTCTICERIKLIQAHQNPYFVWTHNGLRGPLQPVLWRLHALFSQTSRYRLHHLPAREVTYLEEMVSSRKLVRRPFMQTNEHWTTREWWRACSLALFPRHNGDTPNPGPVWWTPLETIYGDDVSLDIPRLPVEAHAQRSNWGHA